MQQNRIDEIDIMRGIGILLVVLGHSGFPYTNFVYSFHMPFFLVLSGYCFSLKYTEKINLAIKMLYRRAIRLWIPFTAYNILFIVLQNVFIEVYVYTDNAALFAMLPGEQNILHEKLSVGSTLIECIKAILFAGDTQMGGAMWYLRALFLTTVLITSVHYFVNTTMKKCNGITKDLAVIVMVVAMGSFGYTLQYIGFNFYNIGTVFSSCILFEAGIQLRKHNVIEKFTKTFHFISFTVSMGLLVLFTNIFPMQLGNNQYQNVVVLLLSGIAGFVFVFEISSILNHSACLKAVAVYLGKKTISIMALHFLTFKIVNFIVVSVNDWDIGMIATFPIVISDGAWWLAYTITGICLPLLVANIFGCMKKNVNTAIQKN